jgi:hypothetical protein
MPIRSPSEIPSEVGTSVGVPVTGATALEETKSAFGAIGRITRSRAVPGPDQTKRQVRITPFTGEAAIPPGRAF